MIEGEGVALYARVSSDGQPARAPTCRALRVGQRADRRSLRISLCSPRPGRRGGPLRSRRRGGLHRPSDFRLRFRENKHTRGLPPPGTNGLPDATRCDAMVWKEVRALLEDPSRVEDEYRRRLAATRDGIVMPEEIARLDRQSATLRRGIERLIDSYAEGVLEKAEFTPRIAGLKQRLSLLEERRQAAEDAVGLERDLSLIISRTEDFAAKVVKGLDSLDSNGRREIIRTVVRQIEINQDNVEVIFRVPPKGGSPEPGPINMPRALQHCTEYGRPSNAPSRGLIVAAAWPKTSKISPEEGCAAPAIGLRDERGRPRSSAWTGCSIRLSRQTTAQEKGRSCARALQMDSIRSIRTRSKSESWSTS